MINYEKPRKFCLFCVVVWVGAICYMTMLVCATLLLLSLAIPAISNVI